MNIINIYSEILVKGIFSEITNTRNAGSFSATVIMLFVAIDTMAYLSMPETQKMNTKHDFINWVDKYMKADRSQSYQYSGKDMYGARCAKLHSYTSKSEYAEKNHCKYYGYHTLEDHIYNPKESKRLVLISIERLVSDFGDALMNFIRDAAKNPNLKARIDRRLSNLYSQFDIQDKLSQT